jgi:hypothetical protein
MLSLRLRGFFGSLFGACIEKLSGLCRLRTLDLAVEKLDLFGLHPVSAQERFKGVHQEHLYRNQLRENVHGHFRLICTIRIS